jgi:hypothetical protein
VTFNEFFKEVVFLGTAKVTGESSAQAILFHVKFAKNASSPERVHQSLEEMLGKIGANAIEQSIIRQMFAMLRETVPEEHSGRVVDFVAYVDKGKKIFLSRSEKP